MEYFGDARIHSRRELERLDPALAADLISYRSTAICPSARLFLLQMPHSQRLYISRRELILGKKIITKIPLLSILLENVIMLHL